ncbi:2-hydroxychromene-2-carboxylate isomerase [Tropicimonas sp. S265A]|uniref:2-hydroxychromene-2-carboxylate isomerase n=1 Tax=Tropicimonas sp. S265A TaxID=3415134 RepID=UPI003C7B03EA
MGPRLTFWFELASTYSYLSAMRIDALAEAAGVEVDWRPVPLGPIFALQGWKTSPFNIYAAKGAYMWRDMERICAARELPFQRPAPFPQNSIRAARVALAALETPQGPEFVRALYSAQFAYGADIALPEVIVTALEEVGLPALLMEAAGSPMYKERLKDNSAEAVSLGLFGAPSFTVGTEVFWGDDRLEDALDWAKVNV